MGAVSLDRERMGRLALPLGMAVAFLGAALVVRADHLPILGLLAAVAVVGLLVTARLGAHVLLLALLVAGYASGYVKLKHGSLLGYVVPELLCVVFIAVALLRRRGEGLPLPRSPLTHAILALTLLCALHFLNPLAPPLRTLAGFRAWVLYPWLFFAGYELLREERQVRQVYAVMLICCVMAALYGLWQWHQGPSALLGYTPELDRHAADMRWDQSDGTRMMRAFSTFGHPAMFGTNMALGILLCLVMALARGTSRWIRLAALLAAPLLAAGLAASGSRGAAVLLVVGCLVLLVSTRGRALLPALALILGCCLAAVAMVSPQVGERFLTLLDLREALAKLWGPMTVAIGLAQKYPLGMGLGFTAGVPSLAGMGERFSGIRSLNVDSGYGSALAEMGVVGLLAYLGLIFAMVRGPLQHWRRLPEGTGKDLMLFPLVLAAGFVAASVVAVPHASLPYSIFFWVLLGALARAAASVSVPAPVPAAVGAWPKPVAAG